MVLLQSTVSGQHGYSYSTFSGPVSGEIRQITVPQHYNHHPLAAPTHHHPSYNAKIDYVVSIANCPFHNSSFDWPVVHDRFSMEKPLKSFFVPRRTSRYENVQRPEIDSAEGNAITGNYCQENLFVKRCLLSLSPYTALSQLNPVHIHKSCFIKLHTTLPPLFVGSLRLFE